MTRNIHRNVALLRSLGNERKANYERDKSDEIKIGRICEMNDIPIRASLKPSRNGFIFPDEEIALATVRQRYVECCDYVLKHGAVNKLYGNLHFGCGDSILQRTDDKVPLSKEERDAIHAVHIEDRTIHRQNNPDEYGLWDSWTPREAPPRVMTKAEMQPKA